MTTVVPAWRSPTSVSRTPRELTGSSPDVGSSSSSTSGLVSSSTAIDARLRCPPDSEPTATSARLARPRSSRTPSTSSRASMPERRSRRRRAAWTSVRRSGRSRWMMFSCGTRPIRPEPALRCASTWSAPRCTDPRSGRRTPAITSSSVVLPAPLLPATATSEPRGTSRSTASSRVREPTITEAPRTANETEVPLVGTARKDVVAEGASAGGDEVSVMTSSRDRSGRIGMSWVAVMRRHLVGLTGRQGRSDGRQGQRWPTALATSR